jgi:WD40 repeat protein
VYALVFSADGRFVATGHNDGTARVLDTRTGQEIVTVKRGKRVYDIAFNARGDLLATAHDDRTARLWDLPSGNGRAVLRHDNVVYAMAFPEDGSTLATATGIAGRAPVGGAARVWSHATGEILATLGYRDASGFFYSARFSNDGLRLAVLSSESTLMIYEMTDETRIEEIPGVAFGDTIALGPDGAVAVAWTTGGGSAYGPDGRETRLGPDEPLRAVALDPSGSLAATAGEDGLIHLWPLR